MTILGLFPERGSFVPANTDEYFALQLAKRFADTENVHRYVGYARSFSHEQLLDLYKDALGGSSKEAATRFHSSFTQPEP